MTGLIDEITGHEDFDVHAEWHPRSELLRIARMGKRRDELKTLLQEITFAYRIEMEKLEAALQESRQQLIDWIEHENGGQGVNFPDVGRAHTRTLPAKVEVEDTALAESVAREYGCLKQVADMPALKAKVLDDVVKGTGEIPPGLLFVKERKGVVVTTP